MIVSVALVGCLVAGAATQWAAPASVDAAASPPRASGEAAAKGVAPTGEAAPADGAANPEGGTPPSETTPTAPPPSPAEPSSAADATELPASTAETPGEGSPAVGAEGSPAEAEPVEPAALPSSGPPAPERSDPRAYGGAREAPLPRPPDEVDPSLRVSTPWRGRFWLGVGLGASFPLGGRPPAAGGVIAVAGEIDLGWRLNRFLALHTSISSFAHDAAQQTVITEDGTPVAEVELGRITAFDLLTARVFAPVHRRIDPWVEVGAGVGSRRAPFAATRHATGLVRVGAGVDFWLAPTLTLGVSTVYRTIIIGDAVGHGLRAGADFGIHW
jgi:hypothetical protein